MKKIQKAVDNNSGIWVKYDSKTSPECVRATNLKKWIIFDYSFQAFCPESETMKTSYFKNTHKVQMFNF